MEQLLRLYKAWKGCEAAQVEKLPGAGSNRIYYRMTDAEAHTIIGVVGTSREENHAFIALARHFATQGLPVPQVLAAADDEMRYLQTDLGSLSLFDAIAHGRQRGGRYDEKEIGLLRQTIRLLPAIQFRGGQHLDYSVCYPQPSFDETGVMFDLNYFKYCFLKPSGVDFHELKLEKEFRQLADDLLQDTTDTFLYRDFQARNVMLCEGRPFFIDFQGGRRGPVYYDLASFLWQASARYSATLRQQLVGEYYAEALHYGPLPPPEIFGQRLRLFVFFRILQVLGAYGYRGYFERKRHFIDSIPPALDNLSDAIAALETSAANVKAGYPYLFGVLKEMITRLRPAISGATPQPAKPAAVAEKAPLVVRIFSFSYKKGIPSDESGNGGGYVFDCRSTHNPGRYEPYKQLTGLDEPVIRFLEDDGEILTFLESIYRLADAHVKRYMERGFTNLMFSFGCTGGQHRSVYSAEHLALHLNAKYGIEVRLCHREQGISRVLPQRQPSEQL